MWRSENTTIIKKKPKESRKPEDRTVTDMEHAIGPTSTRVPQKGRNSQNVVNWDIMQNVVDQHGK